MEELWQLYNESGSPMPGKGAVKNDVYRMGLLHGAAHVWIWRSTKNGKEVLLQRRAADKHTWPSLLDISAAGHIDLGEAPEEAAVRETREEIGLEIDASSLHLIGKHRVNMRAENGAIENEFRWIYLLEVSQDIKLKLEAAEVASTEWTSLEDFKTAVLPNKGDFVPQGDDYFTMLISALS